MSLPVLHRDPTDIDRLPSCGHGCVRVRAFNERSGGLNWMLSHDPAEHERYGAMWALQRNGAPRVFRTGPLTIDCWRLTATINGQDIHLTDVEAQILACLAARAGQVVPYGDIMAEVWNDRDVQGYGWGHGERAPSGRWHLVRTNLTRIRKKLGLARRLLVTRAPVGLELLAEEPV